MAEVKNHQWQRRGLVVREDLDCLHVDELEVLLTTALLGACEERRKPERFVNTPGRIRVGVFEGRGVRIRM